MRKTAILFALIASSGLILTASPPLYAQAPTSAQPAPANDTQDKTAADEPPTDPTTPPEKAPPAPPQTAKDQADNEALDNEAARVQRQVEEQKLREQRRAAQEARLRSMISGYGFTSAATQDAILDYLRQEGEARGPLNEASRRLISALRNGTPPERVRDLMNDYKAAVQADRDRRTAAQAALDVKVGFSLDPRLEALLWVSGIVGDGQGSPVQVLNAVRSGNNYGGGTYNGTPPDQNSLPVNLTSRQGVTIGSLLSRGDVDNGEFWVEVGSERGDRERYLATWNAQTSSIDPKVVKAISETPIGSRVRVEWNGNDRKRIVSMTLAIDGIGDDPVTPPTGPANAVAINNRVLPENSLTSPPTTHP